MNYCSQAHIEAVIGTKKLTELTRFNNTDTTPDGAVVDTAIAEASALVDMKLRQRYEVPFDDPPPKEIIYITKQLAIAQLYMNRMGAEIPESRAMQRDKAMQLLDELASGEAALSEETATSDTSSRTVMIANTRPKILDATNY